MSQQSMGETPQYLASRIRDALANDERTSELGITVLVRGDQIFLRGDVMAAERCGRITDVASEVAPGLRIHNEVRVVEADEPTDEEKLQ